MGQFQLQSNRSSRRGGVETGELEISLIAERGSELKGVSRVHCPPT